MLTARQFDLLVDPILELYERYQQTVINDIARRLARLGKVTAASAWQMQRVTESGAIYDDILAKLASLSGQSEAALRAAFEKAGVQALRFDDAIYKAAGLDPIPLNLSPAMVRVLRVALERTQGLFQNLTRTTAVSGQQAFERAADLIFIQVTSGGFDYQSALRSGIKQVASEGLTVIQFAGRRDQLDVALRRTVLTGIGQATGELQWARADEMGVDLVQTTAHAGARNKGTGPANHESWQGKVFSRSGTSADYPDFVSVTGYGTGEGLGGWNCRHSFYPFFPGISENAYSQAVRDDLADRTVTYRGRQMDMYAATQQQRHIERQIRRYKRQAAALEAAGLDSAPEMAKVRAWQAEMRAFVRQTGLPRQSFREQVYHK
mgnify:CR=1 FL=1